MANVLAAMRAIFCAIASCLPIGWPHCTRSLPHSRIIRSIAFDVPTAVAASVRRPVLSVISASFSPWPSAARMFSRGTRTFVKRITPFEIAFRPMNSQR